jgi:hypothetical protein
MCREILVQQKDTVVTLPAVTERAGTIVSAEVNKAFPEAKKLKWYNLNKDYLAKFIENDMKQYAQFSKEGNMIYNVSYGFEKNSRKTFAAK